MNQTPPSERQELGRAIATASRLFMGHMDAGMAHSDIGFHRWLVLAVAAGRPGLSQRDLAQEIGLESSTLTHHLEKLEKDGLVARVRDFADRRILRVDVTDHGRQCMLDMIPEASILNDEVADVLTDREVKQLLKSLGKINNQLRLLAARPNR
jgi:MarR family transcriptional regulator, transcriptional regulator for hemolysin